MQVCVCVGVRAHACVDICVYVCTRVCVIRSALVSVGQYEVFDSSVKCVRITNHTLGFLEFNVVLLTINTMSACRSPELFPEVGQALPSNRSCWANI